MQKETCTVLISMAYLQKPNLFFNIVRNVRKYDKFIFIVSQWYLFTSHLSQTVKGWTVMKARLVVFKVTNYWKFRYVYQQNTARLSYSVYFYNIKPEKMNEDLMTL